MWGELSPHNVCGEVNVMGTQSNLKVYLYLYTSGALRLENRIIETQRGLARQTVLVDYDNITLISEEPVQIQSPLESQA